MRTQRRVFEKLSETTKVELASERIELARKAPSVLKDLQKLDLKLRKAEDSIDKIFVKYRNEYKSFQSSIKDVEGDRKKLENDIADINQIAMDLGVDFSDVDGLKEANDLSRKLDGLTSDLPKLYKKPE